MLGVAVLSSSSCAHPGSTPALSLQSDFRIESAWNGDVIGLVVDSVTGEPIRHAVVTPMKGHLALDSLRVAADSFGVFRFRALASGPYELKVQYLGYCTRTLHMTMPPPTSMVLLAVLAPARCEKYIDLIKCTCE